MSALARGLPPSSQYRVAIIGIWINGTSSTCRIMLDTRICCVGCVVQNGGRFAKGALNLGSRARQGLIFVWLASRLLLWARDRLGLG
jgi:hypothetical protein